MDKKGSLRDGAIRILGESPSPLRPGRIIGKAMAAGLLAPGLSSIKATVRDILDYDVDHNGDRSMFARTPSGNYGLNKNRSPAPGATANPRATMTASILEAAAAILGGALTPLPLEMIVDRAITEGLIRPTPRTLSLVLEVQILQDILREGSQSEFVRTETGHYGLRSRQRHYGQPDIDPASTTASLPHLPFPRARYGSESANMPVTHDNDLDLSLDPEGFVIITKPPAKQPIDKSKPRHFGDYMGKGGEYLVASKLLFLKYDVSVPIVDIGADLITTSSFGHSFIQVKTAASKRNSYRIGIKVGPFKKHAGKNMFYVFVLRQPSIPRAVEHFLIFPHRALEKYIEQEHIQQGSKNISMKFIEEGGKLLLGPQNLDVSYYKDNWSPFLTPDAQSVP